MDQWIYILRRFFLLFCVFLLQWGWWGGGGGSSKNVSKWPEIQKSFTSDYFPKKTSNSHHLWYAGLNSTSLFGFSHFWKYFGFTTCYRHKKVKNVLQNDIFSDIFSDIYPIEHPMTMIFDTQKDIQVASKTF